MNEYESYKTEYNMPDIFMYLLGEEMGDGILPVVEWKPRKKRSDYGYT